MPHTATIPQSAKKPKKDTDIVLPDDVWMHEEIQARCGEMWGDTGSVTWISYPYP